MKLRRLSHRISIFWLCSTGTAQHLQSQGVFPGLYKYIKMHFSWGTSPASAKGAYSSITYCCNWQAHCTVNVKEGNKVMQKSRGNGKEERKERNGENTPKYIFGHRLGWTKTQQTSVPAGIHEWLFVSCHEGYMHTYSTNHMVKAKPSNAKVPDIKLKNAIFLTVHN